MPRTNRVDVGGYAYHVLNRVAGRRRLFRKNADYESFEQTLAQALAMFDGEVDLLAYCVMPSHWHLVLFTHEDGVLSPFMKWLTLTHTQRYRAAHRNVGLGPIYQGRFRSFLLDHQTHLLPVCRYVERNPVRAGLVDRAEDWRWSSLWRWQHPDELLHEQPPLVISDWPAPGADGRGGRPRQWLRTVNAPLRPSQLQALQTAAHRSRPVGEPDWVTQQVKRFGLQSTLRPRGRPRLEDTP